MGAAALDTFRKNGYDIHLHAPVHSTDMNNPDQAAASDTKVKSNAGSNDTTILMDVLVHELLDSELIGEGLIHSMIHARKRLTKPFFFSVPCRARLIVQAVQSELLVMLS